MNTLKHVVVDGGAGLLIGSAIDAVFQRIHPAKTTSGWSPQELAILAFKITVQAFAEIAVGVEVSQFLYPGDFGDDPTNGFFLLFAMFEASPHFRADLGTLTGVVRASIDDKLFKVEQHEVS
jgi:hypothetical protein